MAKGEFSQYVKMHYEKVRHLPAKERMKELAKMFKEEKARGGGFFDIASDLGKNVLNTLGSEEAVETYKKFGKNLAKKALQKGVDKLFGGALPEGRVARSVKKLSLVPPSVPVDRTYSAMTAPFAPSDPHEREVAIQRKYAGGDAYQGVGMGLKSNTLNTSGGGLLGSLFPPLGMLGLGLEKKKRGRPAGAKGKAKNTEGAGLLGSLFPPLEMLGLGLEKKKRGRPSKAVSGGGFLSDALGAIGLGLPKGMRDKALPYKFSSVQKKKLHSHISAEKGGDFASYFLKGLSLPFSIVSKIPGLKDIPILGQAAQIIPKATEALGVSPLF